ncbi:MAG: laccase domain-containing protein [Gammaproteobacteria bacterium]|nr:laccase domain-containing protein [Gammaproteobacteria bacterium]MBU1819360.1 laccase domain-containing protein [Gammaproteobacteria bacterium]
MTTAARQAPHADWLVPDWPAPASVHALCTTRAGGVSVPPYDSLNLGTHVGDDPAAVQTNRNTLQRAVQARTPGARATFLNQVHGVGVAHVDLLTPDGTDADACITTTPGAVCTIMVADCLPVLLAHRSGAVVGAAHAGWRGLAGADGCGVIESVFECFKALVLDGKALAAINSEANSSPGGEDSADDIAKDTLVWLGPCIGPEAFEVGAEVRSAFCDIDTAAQHCFVPRADAPGKYLCDLAGLARLRLRALGITHIYGNNSTAPWCTVANASRFFSHRRDSAALGGSGRFAACIWRD